MSHPTADSPDKSVMTQPRPEPIFNAPWPPLLAVASILIPHLLLGGASDVTLYQLALVPARVLDGDWAGLLTYLVVHGGWAHAVMNAVFALAFGAPVARLLGLGLRGGGLFVLFYMVCGALAGLGYAAIHPASPNPLVGASGAVAGLMGAAARLMDRPGVLSGLFSPRSMSMAVAWLVVNLVLAVVGAFPGFGTGAIAWEAHLFGFAAGALLIGPVAGLVSRPKRPGTETH